MKRIKYLFFSLLLLFSMTGFAKANTIYSIDITAVLDEDGNAKIKVPKFINQWEV